MRFSIICPIYNSSEYLEQCLASMLKQTYDDYEILLIDDGSTDSSLNICKKYAKDFENVKLFSKINEGPFLTRQFGIKKAIGDYLLFVDSDDLLVDNALEILNNIIIMHKTAELIIFRYKRFPSCKINSFDDNVIYNKKIISGAKEIFNYLFFHNKNSELVRKCIKRSSALLSLNENITSTSLLAEDLLQSVLFYPFVKSCILIDDELYLYRTNFKSLTHKKNKISAFGEYLCYKQIFTFLSTKFVFNIEEKHALLNEIKGKLMAYLYTFNNDKLKSATKEYWNVYNDPFVSNNIINLDSAKITGTLKNRICFKLFVKKRFRLLHFLSRFKKYE